MINSSLDVTIICITFDQPESVKRFIFSVREFYPDIPVIIGCQGKVCDALAHFFDAQKVIHLNLASDCSAARVRNVCISKANTEFILFCDDDFIFTEKTDLSVSLKALQACSELGVVTGLIINRERKYDRLVYEKSHAEKNLYLDKKNNVLITVPIFYMNPNTIRTEKIVYYKCDIGLSLALVRKAVFSGNIYWDENFRYNAGHEDFYLNLKYNSHWEVVYSPDFSCLRQQDAAMDCKMLQERQAEWSIFSKKWGVREHLDIGSGLRVFDTYLDPGYVKQDFIQSSTLLPPYKDSYLRLLPNGECLASDITPDILYQGKNNLQYNASVKWAEIEKAYQKYRQDKATIIWKIVRPFMKLEQSLRKRVKRLKAHG